MSSQAQYASIPRFEAIQVSVANAARDGTGTITKLLTAGTSVGSTGSRLDALGLAATGTTTAGTLHFFYRANSAASWKFWFDLPVQAVVPSASVAPWQWALNNIGFVLPAGVELGVAPNNAETFNIYTVLFGDF